MKTRLGSIARTQPLMQMMARTIVLLRE